MLKFSKKLQESNKIGNESQRARVVFTLAFLEGGTLKKIKIKFCSVIVCIALVFQVTLNNNNDCYYDYETEATGLEVPVAYGIWEIIMGLLLSAGVVYIADSAVEDDWLDVNTEEYEEQGELYLYLKRAYNANLKVIEGTGDGGQEPSESPSPSPDTGLPGDQSQANRYWDALVTAHYEDNVIKLTSDEWTAWRMTVEQFVNQAYLYGDDYNILNTSTDLIDCIESAKAEVKELTGIEYKYYHFLMRSPGYPIYNSTYGTQYDLYLFPPGSYYNLSDFDIVYNGARSQINVTLLDVNTYPAYFFYWRESEGFNGENSIHASKETSNPHTTVFYTDYFGTNCFQYSIPLAAPDLAPYIGDQPSEETITTVPEVLPDPDSEEENKPYVIPDGMPQPMKLPASDDIQKLYENIQDNPDGAQDAVKSLQQDLMSQAETDSDPIEPTPAPSTSPDSDFSSKAGNYMYDFSDLFPFCIPKDFYNLLCVFNAEAEAPKFEIPFDIDYGDIQYHEVFILDMSDFESVVKIFRLLCIVSFILMLIWVTRNFIKW